MHGSLTTAAADCRSDHGIGFRSDGYDYLTDHQPIPGSRPRISVGYWAISGALISPLVSIIIPTRGRPELTSIALHCALDQTYAPDQIEIIIFDDIDFPSFSDPPVTQTRRDNQPPPPVRYFRHPRSLFPTLGDKRNAMCEEARGDIIVHVDSDDLSAPERIAVQVNALLLTGKDISGFHTLPFYDIPTGLAYVYHLNKACVCGTSLVYRRSFWLTHPFPSDDIGEDLPYTSGNREHRTSMDGRQLLVALLHAGNMSSRKQVRNYPTIFPQIPPESLPAWFRYMESIWWTPNTRVSVTAASTLEATP